MSKIMDLIMGREEESKYMHIRELPERKPDKKPTPAEFERHLKDKYGIELIQLED